MYFKVSLCCDRGPVSLGCQWKNFVDHLTILSFLKRQYTIWKSVFCPNTFFTCFHSIAYDPWSIGQRISVRRILIYFRHPTDDGARWNGIIKLILLGTNVWVTRLFYNLYSKAVTVWWNTRFYSFESETTTTWNVAITPLIPSKFTFDWLFAGIKEIALFKFSQKIIGVNIDVRFGQITQTKPVIDWLLYKFRK